MYNITNNNLRMQSRKDASSLRNKPFPDFDELEIIFGKDQATGDGAEL